MKISKPDINSDLTSYTFNDLVSSQTIEDGHFDKQDSSGIDATNVSIMQSKITGTLILGSNFNGSRWRDVLIKSSNFSALRLSSSDMTRVQFEDCKLQGIDFNTAELIDVTFNNCNLDLSNFRSAKLRRVTFDGCTMIDSDFMSSKLSDIVFTNCQIDKVNFINAYIKNVDLSGSRITNIQGISSLRGITIDSTQLFSLAPELAATLGIKVKN